MNTDETEHISQITFEKSFIKSLLDKLKIGNRRGIHLNAVPGSSRSRLDLNDLDIIKSNKGLEFLNTLLTEEDFKFTINFDSIDLTKATETEKEKLYFVSRKLNNISIDNEDQFLDSGIKNFGLGYPLLIRRDSTDPTKVIKAPLFIWNLDIKRSNRKNNEWEITKTVDNPIRVNELLKSHISKDSQVEIESINEDILADNILDGAELVDLSNKILSQLNIGDFTNDIASTILEKCPDGKKIDAIATDNAWIQWSAVFGLYTSRKESVINQMEELFKRLTEFKDQKLILDKFRTSTISSVDTDPSKEQIVNTLTEHEIKLIQGPPGTGKSQALTAIITNVIQNNGTCLVVCEKKTALNVIYHNLEKLGLSNMAIIIDDISKDRSAVVKKARQSADERIYMADPRTVERSFKTDFDKYITLREQVNQRLSNERSSKVDDMPWKDAIGQFMQLAKSTDWEKTKELFQGQSFPFDDFKILEEKVEDAAVAYGQLDASLIDVFAKFNTDFFNDTFSRKKYDDFKNYTSLNVANIAGIQNSIKEVPDKFLADEKINLINRASCTQKLEDLYISLDILKVYAITVSQLYELIKNIEKSQYIINGLSDQELSIKNLENSSAKLIYNHLLSLFKINHENITIIEALVEIESKLNTYISTTPIITNAHRDLDIENSLSEITNALNLPEILKQEYLYKSIIEKIIANLESVIKLGGDNAVLKNTLNEKIKQVLRLKNSPPKDKVIKEILRHASFLQSYKQIKEFETEAVQNILSLNASKISNLQSEIQDLKEMVIMHDHFENLDKKFNNSFSGLIKVNLIEFSKAKSFKAYVNCISDLDNIFQDLQNNAINFPQYYQWNNYMLSLSTDEITLIQRLINSNISPDKWKYSINAWMLYQELNNLEEKSATMGGFIEDDTDLERLTILHNDLKSQHKKLILSRWKSKLNNVIPTNFKLLYNLRKNKAHNKTNSLRTLVSKDFKLFTSLFPIILTNPLAVDSIFPLKLGLFDLVIFDEASQLRIEDTFTSLIRGKYKVVAGDVHQMPPSNYFQGESKLSDDDSEEITENTELALSDSLLDYTDKLGFGSQSYLDYHYRSQHPALIEFSNVAFYGGNLVPFPEKFAYNPIEYFEVNGIYNNNINSEEVEKVISILKGIEKDSLGQFPSVGIATFNINQRNAIIDRINEETISDSDFGRRLDLIKESENGFFVKNLENIQGDEMDIIIISTTYGKDINGKFFERFGPLLLEKGYKLLNVLITRAKEKIYICSSIPSSKTMNYQTLLEEYGNNRKAVLYSYLEYAKAISKSDLKRADKIKQDLLEHSHDKPRFVSSQEGLIESPFEQEVYECLIDVINKEDIVPQMKIGGFRVDFLINLEGDKIIVECDGKSYHSSNEAYIHDIFRQRELENLGYTVYRIWSTNWWHDHTREINNLLSFLQNRKSIKTNKAIV